MPIHAQIGDIWIDCSVREQHEKASDVTSHPVEEGGNVTDHVQKLPDVIVIQGVVSNTPVDVPKSHMDGARVDPSGLRIEGEPAVPGALGLVPFVDNVVALANAARDTEVRTKREFNASVLHFTQPFDRVRAVDAALQQAHDRGVPITVITALRTYENAVLRGLTVNRDASTGKALWFEATAQVIEVVSSQTVSLPVPLKTRAVKPVAKGTKTAEPVDPATLNSSTLARMAGI